MKTQVRIYCFAILLFFLQTGWSQGLEFVENKGQWDTSIQFKGTLANGAFLLQKNGYRVLLHQPQDMENLAAYFSGHYHGAAAIHQPQGGNGGSFAQKTVSGNNKNTPAAGPPVVHSHVYQLSFTHASGNPQVIADKPLESYNNYFIGKDSSRWANSCRLYQAVLYKNMYQGIDVRYYSNNGSLKYDIIVNPGADISQLALQFDGADQVYLKSEKLYVRTSVGEVSELKPYAYQSSAQGRREIQAKYSLQHNTIRFRLDAYDPTIPLVIDPTLVFSTFTGSTADNWAFSATYDNQGNFYAGGIAFADNRFPVSNGAFQTNFQGGNSEDDGFPMDMAIMKFNSSGSNRLYATYLGGSGNEQPHSLVTDNSGNLVIAGRTNSTNFPTTLPLFGKGGGFDIFLAKLNAAGTQLIASRTFGGTGSDGVNIAPKDAPGGNFNGGAISLRRNYGDDSRSEVILDGAGNIYLVSQTRSDSFPVTANAIQRTLSGQQDAVLLKTSSNIGTILTSTYLGGRGDDAAFVISLNPTNNNIYIAGGTTSDDFPGNKTGVYIPAFRGGVCDGFVAVISNDGSTLLRSSYFGTSGNDLIFGIQFDAAGYPYIMGTTTGNWPVTPNVVFKQNNGKQFIAKLRPDLSDFVYSTVFGKGQGKPDISPTAFLVDRCENVYVSGWGGDLDYVAIPNGTAYENSGTNGLTTTPDALIPASPQRDDADFYFFVMKRDATAQLYGSMFGQNGGLGDHVDGGTSRFDKQGVVYQAICANCNRGAVFPTTAGAWSSTNRASAGAACNLAAVKIAFNLAGVHASIRSAIEGVTHDSSGCVPLQIDFTDTMALGKTYSWNFGDGSPDTTTLQPRASHTFTQPGIYQVRLISIDSASCNIQDTAYLQVRARQDKAVLSFTTAKLPPCESLTYQFTNTSTSPSGKPFGSQSFQWVYGDSSVSGPLGLQPPVTHNYQSAGTYQVTLRMIDTNFCNYPDSLTRTIRLSPNVKAQFTTPPAGCFPYTAVLTNTSLAGQSFFWNFGDGTTSTEESPSHNYTQTGTFTIQLVARDPSTCNLVDSTQRTLTVSSRPVAGFSYGPLPPQENTPVVFTNSSSGATRYVWHFGDGDTLQTANRDTAVSHIYGATNTFNTCLLALNNFGCTDSVCQPVHAIIVPLVDVPNAFTPNGDGINDRVNVKGYGISKLNFRIYNRWGALVFQSLSVKGAEGWDGRYNGALQPQDVYVYVADIEFADGTKYQKKGDITLLR